MSDDALLSAEQARIAIDGVTMIESLSLATRGDRVILAGGADVLMAALCGTPRGMVGGPSHGLAQVVRGQLRLLGCDVATGKHCAVAGFAPLDPALPASWTVEEYVGWGARLAGASRRGSRALVAAALERLELSDARRTRLSMLAPPLRRGLMLAAAIVREPKAIVVENPFAMLDDESTARVMAMLARATEGRRALISVPRLAGHQATVELARVASDVAVLRDGTLVAHAQPATLFVGVRLYELTVASGEDALRKALAADGVELSGGPRHFSLRLPEGMSVSDILRAAARARAAVVACLPVL